MQMYESVCECVCVGWPVGVAIWSLEQDTEINSPSKFKKENWLILSCKPHGIILSIGVSLSLLGSNQGGGCMGWGVGGRKNKL